MRIAILGTRGIPNHYGGFERFAEVISQLFSQQGHEVFVLSPSVRRRNSHLYIQNVCVVNIHISGTLPSNVQTLYYDLKSLIWARRNNVDIVLECGYSYAPWLIFFSRKFRKKIVTNPDGIEFKREKWSFWAKSFLRISEFFAVKLAGNFVCDSPALSPYFIEKFGLNPAIIPYGAFPLITEPSKDYLFKYSISSDYFLMISRFTPENNIDTILTCFTNKEIDLVVVGDFNNSIARKYYNRFRKFSNIKFLGGIYDQDELNALRYYAKAYIHGHSVGGTNPSLLEAMACKSFVIAHDNSYNRFVLNSKGLFFTNLDDLSRNIDQFTTTELSDIESVKEDNYKRIMENFSWQYTAYKYEKIFQQML